MKPLLQPFPTGFKIASLFLLLLVGVVFASFITEMVLMIPGVNDRDNVTAIYVASVMQAIFGTGLSAYLIAALTDNHPVRFLKIGDRHQLVRKLFFAVLAFIFSYTLASFLTQWNKGMILPASMQEIEQVLRTMEDAALETSNLLLSGKTIGRLLLNLLVVAGFAAVSEELFFRGALQQLIQEKFPNGHVAVWITALVFSVVHFQFYGFLPRLLLGGLLGYLFLYTQNLLVPIVFHFINNALIIILYYFYGDSQWLLEMEELPVDGWFVLAAIISALCTVFLFRIFIKKINKLSPVKE